MSNDDIVIDISSTGGFLAYLSGSGGNSSATYCFTAGGGAYNLKNYFTIQEKGTAIDTYYENTNEITHTFESPDIIVVKRTVETPFDSVTWLVNGVKYAIAESPNMMNTLNFPASTLNSGENTITMSVRFRGTTTDSLFTGKVWLSTKSYNAEFYANDVYYSALQDTTFCSKNVSFRAAIEGLHPTDPEKIKWYINGNEETLALNQTKWSNVFENGNYDIKMEVLYESGVTAIRTGILKIQAFWIKVRNVRY